MQGSKVLDLLMSRLGNRTEPALRATCLLEMQLAQEAQLEGGATLPWFLITEDATVSTTTGERRVEVPEDFIREVDQEKPLYYRPSDGSADVKLTKGSYEELMDWYKSDAEGAPEKYALRGDYFMLFPKPDAAYTLVLPGYYARQTAPADSSVENKWLKWAADLMVAATGEVMCIQHLQSDNTALMSSFVAMKKIAYDRLTMMEAAREEANRDRRMG